MSKVVRISLMVLRACVLLALILGILFWTTIVSPVDPIRSIHMLLGVLVVLSLAIIGIALATTGSRGIGLAVVALVWAALVFYVGSTQDTTLPSLVHVPQTVIKIVHLLLGVLAAGIGEMCAGRYKRIKGRAFARAAR